MRGRWWQRPRRPAYSGLQRQLVVNIESHVHRALATLTRSGVLLGRSSRASWRAKSSTLGPDPLSMASITGYMFLFDITYTGDLVHSHCRAAHLG